MKKLLFLLSLCIMVVSTSCEKMDLKDKGHKGDCQKDIEECVQNSYSEFQDETLYREYVVEELVIDESCGCIVEGMLKYVEIANNRTASLIKFASKDCEGYGYKILCKDGKCEHKFGASTCLLELDCEVPQDQ